MDNKLLKEALQATGALAEMSLVFYRAALESGASPKEAKSMLESYMRTIIFSGPAKEAPHE